MQTFVDVQEMVPNALAVGSDSAWILDYHGALTHIEVPRAGLRCGILAPTTGLGVSEDGELSGGMTPELAVQDWLRRMGELSAKPPTDVGPSGSQLTRPQFPPVLASMEIVKRRVVPGRQVVALTYQDTGDGRWFWIIRLIENDEGSWRVCGGGGGSGDPQWDEPYINLGGSWGPYGLALGGRVSGAGTERAASARLRIGETLLVDDTDEGVVLFVTSEPAAGVIATIELMARNGSALWSDELELDE